MSRGPRGLLGDAGLAMWSKMYIPPTVVLVSILGLAVGTAGVDTELADLECVGNRALPGVAGRSCRSAVASDKFFWRRFDDDVFFRGGGIRWVSFWCMSKLSSAMVEFDRSCVSAGVPGDSVESAE